MSYDVGVRPLTVFDYSHPEWAWHKGERALKFLREHRDVAVTGSCLTQHLRFGEHFDLWLTRIRNLDDDFIRETCSIAHRANCLTAEESEALTDFLIFRRDHIEELVEKLRIHFKKDDLPA